VRRPVRHVLAWASVAAVVLGTFTAFWAASDRESTFARRRADAFADRAAASISTVLQTSLATLSGSSALRAPGGVIDPLAFNALGDEVIAHSPLDALAVSVLVTAADRASFEASFGHAITDRGPSGFVPAATRTRYFPVRYVVPTDATRLALLGFDIGGDPERQAAVERAATTGNPQVTPVHLAPSGRAGLFVALPIREQGQTVAIVSSALLGADLAPRIANLLPSGSRFALRTATGDTLTESGHGPYEARASVNIEGLDLMVLADDGAGPDNAVPRFVLGGGLGLALFLGLFFRTTFVNERRLAAALATAEGSERRAAGLLDVSTTFARSLTAAAVTTSLLRWGREQLGATGAAVARVGPGPIVAVLGADGEPVPDDLLRAPDAASPTWIGADDDDTSARALVLPLVADDDIIGVATFLFSPPVPVDDGRRALAEGVAAQAGRALLRAGRRDREQEVTLVLQARLLPPSLPQVPDVELTARYLAATEGTLVGGDWYDAIALPTGRLLLTVGDVVGRGPAAAAVMGQLRTLLHEAALRVDDPAAVVHAVDAFAERTDEAMGSTCVVVEVDPITGATRYCRAGHPWPLVIGPSGARWLDASGGGPLGIRAGGRSSATAQLAGGEALVLFTDGAVERRGEDLEVGFARLAAAASGAMAGGPDAICEAILRSLPPGTDDDVVLLVARGTHMA